MQLPGYLPRVTSVRVSFLSMADRAIKRQCSDAYVAGVRMSPGSWSPYAQTINRRHSLMSGYHHIRHPLHIDTTMSLPTGRYTLEVYSGPFRVGLKYDDKTPTPLYFFNDKSAVFFFEQLGFNRYVVRTSNLNVRSSDPDKYGDVFAFPGGELQEWDLEYQPDYDGFRIFTTNGERAWTTQWVPGRNDSRGVYLHQRLDGTDYFGRQVFVFTPAPRLNE